MPNTQPRILEKQAEKKQQALNLAPTLYHYKWIAAGIGISEKTLNEWKKNDAEFDSQLNQKRAEFVRTNMRKARPDFLLETSDRETFGKKENIDITTQGEKIGNYDAATAAEFSEFMKGKTKDA